MSEYCPDCGNTLCLCYDDPIISDSTESSLDKLTHEELKAKYLELYEENFQMSARLVWFEKFHDIIVRESLIAPDVYKQITDFMFSEDDR